MTISLTDAGKRYNREWIFRHLNFTFHSGTAYAITGSNGSGKSTLLQVVAAAVHHNEGTINYQLNGNPLATEAVFSHTSLCAPYLEVIEEMTLTEFFDFHHSFKPFLAGLHTTAIIELLGLQVAAHKQIRLFSSGMKQRVKLAQCILSDSALVLLDEPCTNLDEDGISLYHKLINTYAADRLVIVSSNDPVEYSFCKEKIRLADYKQ